MYFVILLVIGTTIWVGIDAHNLGVRRGMLSGSFLDLSTAGWVVVCLLLWIIAFPCYLVARGKYQQLRSRGILPAPVYGLPYGGTSTPYVAPQLPYAVPQATQPTPPTAPPQMSADGRWWWNGNQWTPVPPPPTQQP